MQLTHTFTEWETEGANAQARGILTEAKESNSTLSESSIEIREWSLYRAWDNTAPQPLSGIPPVYPSPGTSEVGDKIRVRRGKRGLTALDGALLNAPEMAVSKAAFPRLELRTKATFLQNGWNTHVGAVRNKNSLPGDIRELLVS